MHQSGDWIHWKFRSISVVSRTLTTGPFRVAKGAAVLQVGERREPSCCNCAHFPSDLSFCMSIDLAKVLESSEFRTFAARPDQSTCQGRGTWGAVLLQLCTIFQVAFLFACLSTLPKVLELSEFRTSAARPDEDESTCQSGPPSA